MRRTTPDRLTPRDAGLSLVEILVAIVLLGVGVTAVVGALRASTTASAIDREHATAFAWLHAASDNVYRTDRWSCETYTAAQVAGHYDAAVKDPTIVPDGWDLADPVTDISVTGVEFLGRASFDTPYEWDAAYCFEGAAFAGAEQYTQRVTIQVTTPDGMNKTLQMVKGRS